MTELIVRHCAPTLAGIKTGNLVNCGTGEALSWTRDMRPLLQERGADVQLLCRCAERALLYVYRPGLLLRDLVQPETGAFLSGMGYTPSDIGDCIAKLRERFLGVEFPHEVGLFLGYPLADVVGFIENAGRDYKCCGCWKVYQDEEKARLAFLRYNACTRDMLRSYQRGVGFERLIVANG